MATEHERLETEQLELDNEIKKLELERTRLSFDRDYHKMQVDDLRGKQRTAYAVGDVEDKMAKRLRNQFLEWELETEASGEDSYPVLVLINSFGGYMHNGFEIYDLIHEYREAGWWVDTKATGVAMSAGALILQAGETRFMTHRCQFMMHEAAGWNWGKTSDMRNRIEAVERMEMYMFEALAERSVFTVDEVKDKCRSKDVFLTAEEAQELGFVDRLVA